MINLQKSLICLVLLAFVSCTTMSGGKESLGSSNPIIMDIRLSVFHIPDRPYKGGWKLGHSQFIKGKYAIEEYVPKDESIESWSRLYTEQTLARISTSPANPKDMMAGLRDLMEKRCPDVVWKVIRESEHDILYEYYFENCPGTPSQYEIARIIYGKWNIWRIAYTQKGAPINEQERLKWIENLSEPRIVAQ
ncbi:hypothetical protein SAMN04489760_14913 [Syntrophus gentianae]|uniref:Lipoprotein n=1 Tax=Syntrophus gentianae TaxID=43775 RepID=A0A1H8BD28_9BACT|nr:hypothetical protein [Syntrophus gentianae]SEM79908.1 hypothetical protein SAMN04489760_14913 [Syntrophus gentianae]